MLLLLLLCLFTFLVILFRLHAQLMDAVVIFNGFRLCVNMFEHDSILSMLFQTEKYILGNKNAECTETNNHCMELLFAN